LALKKELLARIAQLDDDENIRKKICYIVAELARNLMGIYIKKSFYEFNKNKNMCVFFSSRY